MLGKYFPGNNFKMKYSNKFKMEKTINSIILIEKYHFPLNLWINVSRET